MDFTERLNLYLEGGMIQPDDVADVQAIITMFDQKYHIVLQEENADTFIAHLCAAFGRSATGEEVEPLPPTEQDYALLHINNLIARLAEGCGN